MRSLVSLLAPVAGTLFAATAVTAAPLPRRATWLPAQGSCWADNVDHERALDKSLGGFDDLTPAKCQSLCEAQGFNLAGVEFGRECFCGNTIFGNNRPTSASLCNVMTCSGDPGQYCGGPDAIIIYVKDSYPFTVGPVSLIPSYQGYENPTCWHDSASTRFLTGHPATDIPADQMTVQKCIDGCAAAGFSSSGLEFGRECYCGNSSEPLADSANLSECNMPCLGDASQFCGGANRLLMYHKPGPVVVEPTPQSSWTPAQDGCWTDSVSARALSQEMGSHEDLTPASCQILCENAGFHLAGVEFGRECWCGNTIMYDNHPQSGICTKPCAGDSSKMCGGPNAINIYVKDNYQYTVGPASVLESYNGYSKTQCWQDLTSNRILKQSPVAPIDGDEMTVQKCIDGCAAAGFSSAGVEFGRECFCDNVTFPPRQSEDMSECNKPCTGDASEICGGPDRILIYYNDPVPSLETYAGVIEVYNVDTNEFLGFVARETQDGIGLVQQGKSLARWFTVQAPSNVGSVSQVEVVAETPSDLDGYPYLGLIQGLLNSDSDISEGNSNYLFVGGTPHSEPGATPQTGSNSYPLEARTYESSVWTFDTATKELTAEWINTDG
ncbi:hypothetical protein FRC17_005529, partial [Serendipita sp. 399]